MRPRVASAVVVVVFLVVVVSSCTGGRRADLLAVALPDMSRSDASVQAQARERHAAAAQRLAAGAADEELGRAFGELGMLLHAAEYFDAAEPAYLNARTLMPADARWTYYLAHLYRQKGDAARAAGAYAEVVRVRPDDAAALIWLGRLRLDQGQAAEAEALFTRARTASPRAVAALAGLGQAKLAQRDYRAAVTLLEEALTLAPQAASLQAPLASAYRGLGDTAKADAHAARWRSTEIAVPDPWHDALRMTLRSAVSFETRGVRAFEAGRFTEAADAFREGMTLTPPDSALGRSLRHKLGLTLYLHGDAAGAVQVLDEATRLAPRGGHDEPAAQAHYSLGVIKASAGRDREAIDHLRAAVQYDEAYLQAQVAVADLLRRTGEAAASLPHYEAALKIDDRAADARFGYAMALVRLRRWVEARRWLEAAAGVHPDRTEFTLALARVLAAAPDARARDGHRALMLGEEVVKTDKRTIVGETIAMALAEIGEFNGAVGIQRGVRSAAQRAGLTADVERMTRNLMLYEQGRPCRTPWPDDDPVHRPGPPVSEQLAKLIGTRGDGVSGGNGFTGVTEETEMKRRQFN